MSKKKCCQACGCNKELCGREARVGGILKQCGAPTGHEGPCQYDGVTLYPYYYGQPVWISPYWYGVYTPSVTISGGTVQGTVTWTQYNDSFTGLATSGTVKVLNGHNNTTAGVPITTTASWSDLPMG